MPIPIHTRTVPTTTIWTTLNAELSGGPDLSNGGPPSKIVSPSTTVVMKCVEGTMLSERLLELQREGLVAKNIYGSRVEYSLTASAKELQAILAELNAWWSMHHPACQPLIAN